MTYERRKTRYVLLTLLALVYAGKIEISISLFYKNGALSMSSFNTLNPNPSDTDIPPGACG